MHFILSVQWTFMECHLIILFRPYLQQSKQEINYSENVHPYYCCAECNLIAFKNEKKQASKKIHNLLLRKTQIPDSVWGPQKHDNFKGTMGDLSKPSQRSGK